MQLKDIEEVLELQRQLQVADSTLRVFESAPGTTVQAQAVVGGCDYGRGARVDLLPVEKALAVSAAKRARSKIVDQLRCLGVSVE